MTSGYAIGERYPTSRPHAVCPCGTISAARSPQLLKRICRLVHRNENRRQPCRAASGTKDGARHEADASRAAAPMAMILTKRHPLIMERLAPWGRLHLRVSRATPLRASGARHRGGAVALAAARRPESTSTQRSFSMKRLLTAFIVMGFLTLAGQAMAMDKKVNIFNGAQFDFYTLYLSPPTRTPGRKICLRKKPCPTATKPKSPSAVPKTRKPGISRSPTRTATAQRGSACPSMLPARSR